MTFAAHLASDPVLDDRRARARTWFESLRERICAAFEQLEQQAPPALYPGEDGRFVFKPWAREEGGGGVMGMMHGRFFEKVGVHVSTVHGTFTPEFAVQMPDEPRRTCAIRRHRRQPDRPHALARASPAVHMNTRYICTTQGWFGGGADLTPLLDYQRSSHRLSDAIAFHDTLRKGACDAHDPAWYAKYKAWCDEYFFLPHRNEPRGIGGIFYDRHDSGDFERDFAFTRDVGEAFLDIYPKIVSGRAHEPWTGAEREEQLVRRGRYVEFNLLYDRGTIFGLKTGGNVESNFSAPCRPRREVGHLAGR